MKTYYIVLSESNHYGWVGGLTTHAKAKKMLKIETETYYIFKYVHKKQNHFEWNKISNGYPYYDGLSINEYKEEVFEEDDDYVIISHDDNTYDKNSLILIHKP